MKSKALQEYISMGDANEGKPLGPGAGAHGPGCSLWAFMAQGTSSLNEVDSSGSCGFFALRASQLKGTIGYMALLEFISG